MKTDVIHQYPNVSMLPMVDDALHKKKKHAPTLEDQEDGNAVPTPKASTDGVPQASLHFEAPDSLRESLEIDPAEAFTSGGDETVSSLVVLETVRKRQAHEPIETADILADFRKTMSMLGVVPQHQQEAETYLNVVRQESTLNEPDTPLMKRLLLKVAKRLDEQVTQALDEESTVVSDWLDALFLQPVEWKPAPPPMPSTGVGNPASVKPANLPSPAPGLSVPAFPGVPERLKHLYVRDALHHLKQLVHAQAWQKAEGVIHTTLAYIRHEEGLRAYTPQWERLQLQNLLKQGKPAEVVAAFVQSSLATSPPLDAALWVGKAHAQQGQFAEALKLVHPLVRLASPDEARATLNMAWLELHQWSASLQNPALERRMAEGLFRFLKQSPEQPFNAGNLPVLARLTTLLELEGNTHEALSIARFRVDVAHRNKAPGQYVQAMKDVVALFTRQGKLNEARKVFGLIEEVERNTRATATQPF